MIQIESVHIEEFRGIRELTLTLNRGSFVVSGPNGSGKSGVVDAIQFALTGEIARLRGAGTGDLTISDHGPHVERRSDPDAAFVRLEVYIPHLKKSAIITRTIKKYKQPVITPNDEPIRAVFANLALHPEVTLSRREIIKFILAEATQRSRDVQTLLKLEDIDQMRATLKTCENKLNSEYQASKAQSESSQESLKRHLDLPTLNAEDLLIAVNKRRTLLGLQSITELKKDTDLSDALATGETQDASSLTKETALKDVGALAAAASSGFESTTKENVKELLKNIGNLEDDPSLLIAIKRNTFYQVIFRLLVQSGAAVAIPIDVYPVYWQIASRARLSVVGFTTFPKFELSRILDAAQEAGAHHVLLPYPLKLHGRAWTNEEVATAKAWLCAGKQRRLILDSVYSFGAQLDSITKRLIESDQVVFLDSLSKAWLHEQVFGVAVIPEQDVEFYSAAFRDLAPAPAKLIVAHELLERFPDIPQQIAQELDTRRAALMARASWAKHQLLPVERGYLVAIECSAEILLTQHSLIAIPASAFGSRRSDWSVASALPVAGTSS